MGREGFLRRGEDIFGGGRRRFLGVGGRQLGRFLGERVRPQGEERLFGEGGRH